MTQSTDDLFATSPDTGWPVTQLLPAPGNPMAVARELLCTNHLGDTLTWWRGDFYRWTGTKWSVWPDDDVKAWLYRQTENALYMVSTGTDRPAKEAAWAPTTKKIQDLANALGQGILQRSGAEESDDGTGTVAFTNGVLDLATMELLEHTPKRFNLHSLPVAYDADADCPRWRTFLGEILEDDADRIALLQEWFGYVLCGGTELQKILSMFGPKRCGKGTVMRVLVALLGEHNVASPATLDSLAGPFGEQKLIGARLAIFSDVQWVGSRLAEAVGILLAISGEDHRDVARKNRTDWKGRLQVRFMFAGNDRPKFSNVSGALPGRMEQLQFRVSFYGREDTRLTEKLMAELSGIFNWALEGWRRLQAQGGRFTQSELGREAAEEVERNASPVAAFVMDECVIASDCRIPLDELYKEYARWRGTENLDGSITNATLSRGLLSAFPTVRTLRSGSARQNNRQQWILGIRMRAEGESILADGTLAPSGGPGNADRADRADRATQLDLTEDVSPGQPLSGPSGPGGPSISIDSQLENPTSAESTSFGDVESAMAKNPGPVRSARSADALTSQNSGPSKSGPARSAFDPETWAPGWDQEPDEAA